MASPLVTLLQWRLRRRVRVPQHPCTRRCWTRPGQKRQDKLNRIVKVLLPKFFVMKPSYFSKQGNAEVSFVLCPVADRLAIEFPFKHQDFLCHPPITSALASVSVVSCSHLFKIRNNSLMKGLVFRTCWAHSSGQTVTSTNNLFSCITGGSK